MESQMQGAYDMKIRIIQALFGTTLLATSLTVNAVIVEVSYTATVYQTYDSGAGSNVGGAGYNVGDSINGSLFIDTDRAPSDSNPETSVSDYYYDAIGDSGFVTGHAADGINTYDSLRVEDDYIGDRDRFYASDHESGYYSDSTGDYGYTDDYIYIDVYSDVLDFISGEGLEQFEQGFDLLASMGGLDRFNGRVVKRITGVENGENFNNYSYGDFNLNSLSVGAIDNVAAVPEPSTIFLMATGLAGLGFASWKKKQS